MINHSHINLESIESVIVAGASSGIGLAMVKNLLNQNSRLLVFATYRSQTQIRSLAEIQKHVTGDRLQLIELKAGCESDFENAYQVIRKRKSKVDGIINCIGYLHGESGGPEKRLSEINIHHFRESFETNSLTVAMLAKHMFPLLKNPSPAVFVSLSARLASIGDNRGGGWYSYRASKCAHNMLVKNIALEFERYRCNTLTLALHPGTTKTKLSAPYIAKTKYTLHSPEQTAANLLTVVSKMTFTSNGGFFDWQGKPIDW